MKMCENSLSKHGCGLLRLFLLAVYATVLSGCNGDVFITGLTVSSDMDKLSTEHPVARIGVSGKGWTVQNISFYNRDEYSYYADMDDGGELHIITSLADLYVRAGRGYVEAELVDYAGNGEATLSFTVTDGYEYMPVEIAVLPAKAFSVKIEDVSYTLDSWGGYPDDNFTKNVIVYAYPEGLPEATIFQFPSPNSLPVKYFFEPAADAGLFTYRVLNSGIMVPVPSYTASFSYDFWTMAGDVAPLSTVGAQTTTNVVPPVPAPVELPAHTPLVVAMTCDYEAVALQCRITALNENTDTRETISAVLRMWVPVKFNAIVEKK